MILFNDYRIEMLVFGHAGLTLGAAVLLAGNKRVAAIIKRSQSQKSAVKSTTSPKERASWIDSLSQYADIRLLFLGSILPDLIDKPVGEFFLRSAFNNNGRIFGHTLLFLLVMTITGAYLYKRHGMVSLLVLSFGTFTHLIFDQMWLNKPTLFWPAYGFLSFSRIASPELYSPQAYLPELAGALGLVWFALLLVRRKSIFNFVLHGRI
jgi:inner membrane protein